MKWCHFLFIPVTLAALAMPAPAGVIFGKRPAKPSPSVRVPELIVTVKTDPDEHKRAAAAEELRQFDPLAFPDIVPVLVDVSQTDLKSGVRSEALTSLSKIRPVSQQAGWALEQASQKDSSMRVRLLARSALLTYHWAGYHNAKPTKPPTPSPEPPLAPPSEPSPVLQAPPAAQTRLVPVAAENLPQSPMPLEPRLLQPPLSQPIQGPELTPP